MADKQHRIADYITRRAFPDTSTEPAAPPVRTTFAEWSRTAGKKPVVWRKRPPQRLAITTRLMATIYPSRVVDLQIGEPFASITPTSAMIRFPEPFDENGLTEACRSFIIDAVRQAITRDGLHRSVIWPDSSSPSHGDQHD